MKDKIVLVEWIDSGLSIHGEWEDVLAYSKRAKEWSGLVRTYGAVIHEDDNVIVIGLSHDMEHDNWYNAQLIHRPSITKIVELGETGEITLGL